MARGIGSLIWFNVGTSAVSHEGLSTAFFQSLHSAPVLVCQGLGDLGQPQEGSGLGSLHSASPF